MSIAEKLTTIAENEQKVYDAGRKSMAVVSAVKGNPAVLDYVHPTEHELVVQLESADITDFSGVEVTKYGANLLPYPYYHTTKTQYGVTFIDNGDGTVTVNGTATGGTAEFAMRLYQPMPDGIAYYLGGCPAGGSKDTYYIINAQTGHYDTGSGYRVGTAVGNHYQTFKIGIKPGTVCNNLVFKPFMSAIKMTYDTWQPYVSQTATANADGTVEGLMSVSPITTLRADDGVTINAEYWLDAESKLEDVGVTLMNLGGSL